MWTIDQSTLLMRKIDQWEWAEYPIILDLWIVQTNCWICELFRIGSDFSVHLQWFYAKWNNNVTVSRLDIDAGLMEWIIHMFCVDCTVVKKNTTAIVLLWESAIFRTIYVYFYYAVYSFEWIIDPWWRTSNLLHLLSP